MIEINDLSKSFGKKLVLDRLFLSLPDTGLFFLVGPNGVGKTTLLNILSGLDYSHGGTYSANNETINKKNAASFHESQVREIFQTPLLLDDFTVIDNLLFPFEDKKTERARRILCEVGLGEIEDEMVSDLSAGERQRLSIAIAIYEPTPILLADEITSNLDMENSKAIVELLRRISNDSLVIFSTHDEVVGEGENVISITKEKGLNLLTPKPLSLKKAIVPCLSETSPFELSKRLLKKNRLASGVFFSLILVLSAVLSGFSCLSFGLKDEGETAAYYVQRNYEVFALGEDNPLKPADHDPVAWSVLLSLSLGESQDGVASKDFFAFVPSKNDYSLLAGDYPVLPQEVCISSFQADWWVTSQGSKSTYGDLLGKKVGKILGESITVSGIYQSKTKNDDLSVSDIASSEANESLYYESIAPFVYPEMDKQYRMESFYSVDDIDFSLAADSQIFSDSVFLSKDGSSSVFETISSFTVINRIAAYVALGFAALFSLVFLNFLYLRNKDNLAFSRLLGVSASTTRKAVWLPLVSSLLLISAISLAFAPLFKVVFENIINGLFYGSYIEFVRFSWIPIIFLASLMALSLIFLGFRNRKIFSRNLSLILRSYQKDDED